MPFLVTAALKVTAEGRPPKKTDLHVEPEVRYVAFLEDIVLALDS